MSRTAAADRLAPAARFHGHLGPWLVLGLRAGAHARKKLRASPFKLSARVFCPSHPPCTCFIDGIQFSSGCTMGKGNIRHVRAQGCRVEFARQGRLRAKFVIELRPRVWDELRQLRARSRKTVAGAGRAFYARRFASLFRVR